MTSAEACLASLLGAASQYHEHFVRIAPEGLNDTQQLPIVSCVPPTNPKIFPHQAAVLQKK